MLAFFAVRGISPEQIIEKGTLTKRFYYHAMELYYKEQVEMLKIKGVSR
ncbi:MAG: hypothetical protein IJ736_16115 [Firmicutes bacterium]|nr:hypothetical protein [Bacillota bacterium]